MPDSLNREISPTQMTAETIILACLGKTKTAAEEKNCLPALDLKLHQYN